MQRADQWLTGDFLDDVAVYPEPERFGHLIILELIGQHDQMRIRKPLLQFAAIVCSEMVRPIVYDDDVTALLFRTSQWSVQLARILDGGGRSEEHTSELQSLMRTSYAVFCLKKKTKQK